MIHPLHNHPAIPQFVHSFDDSNWMYFSSIDDDDVLMVIHYRDEDACWNIREEIIQFFMRNESLTNKIKIQMLNNFKNKQGSRNNMDKQILFLLQLNKSDSNWSLLLILFKLSFPLQGFNVFFFIVVNFDPC